VSVHGEYNRALDSCLALLRERSDAPAREWAERLADTRCGPGARPDLSAAAEACLRLVEKLATDPAFASDPEEPARAARWHEALAHLRAHCCVILGVSESGPAR
jgi:hypothetical protein